MPFQSISPSPVLHPIPHLASQTSQTVSRNSSNFTVVLHRQEKPQQQSLTHEEASLTHHPVTNVHTQRILIFYNSSEKNKQTKTPQINKTLSAGVGPEFSISEHLRQNFFSWNQLISYMLSQRNQFLGLRLFPERCGKLSTSSLNHRTMSGSFASKHYLLHNHECTDMFGYVIFPQPWKKFPPWLPWRRLL